MQVIIICAPFLKWDWKTYRILVLEKKKKRENIGKTVSWLKFYKIVPRECILTWSLIVQKIISKTTFASLLLDTILIILAL